MEYIISFLEGIITFISPCLLPMLPIYIAYFAGGSKEQKTRKTLINALGFVLGFTLLFVTLGAFAASIGKLLSQHQKIVNIITGGIVIIFGLNFAGIWNIPLLNRTKKMNQEIQPMGFFSAVLFGIIFSIGWTPCVGTFLGSALMMAGQKGSVTEGIIMLLFYSIGLGIPFIISALLIDRLKSAFTFIKKHYKTINLICGIILIIVGISMITGYLSALLTKLSF